MNPTLQSILKALSENARHVRKLTLVYDAGPLDQLEGTISVNVDFVRETPEIDGVDTGA